MQLTQDGITMISYPLTTKQAVAEAAKQWRQFTKLRQTTKDNFAASDLHLSVGYEKKGDGSHESRDTKENFDLTRAGIDDLRAHADTSSIEPLLDATTQLLDTLAPTAREFCQAIEREYEIPGFGETAARSEVNRFLRFLYYPPVAEGSVIGEAHTDHSGYTFHLYESTGGCQGLSPDSGEWFDMPVSGDEMAVFGGMQLQLMSQGRIKALCHEITANDTVAQEGRVAIVCFNVLSGVPGYDRSTHGRLQDREPGFNYSLSHDEFSQLFRPSK